MNGLTWLNDLMAWLGRLIPRIILVQASHEAARFDPGGRVKHLLPGLHWFWPIAQNVVVVSVAQRSSYLAPLLLGREVVALVIIYRIVDVVSVATNLYNFASQLDAHASAALHAAYGRDVPSADINVAVLASLRRELGPRGLEVISVSVTQRGWVIPLKNLEDWARHEAVELQ